MKNFVIAIAFLGGILSANAGLVKEKAFNPDDCHAYACEEVAAWEDAGFDFTEAESEQAYQAAYAECQG